MPELNIMPVSDLFGIPVHLATMDQVLQCCSGAIEKRSALAIGVVNAAKVVNMRRDPLLHESVVGSDLILADGMSVVWASRLLGRPLPERVAGIDLFEKLLERANENRWAVYFLGATQKVLDELIRRVDAQYPDLVIAGTRNGYFAAGDSEAVAKEIQRTHADILFVAMSSPHKEVFLGRWGRSMGVPVSHGVGGSFDVLAGQTKRAPRRWQRCGMEWLYRVLQEPRRMWKRYMLTNSLFVWMLLRELIRTGGARLWGGAR